MKTEKPEPDHEITAAAQFTPQADDAAAAAIPPTLQRQVDENLRLLYRSKLQATLPESLQILVQQLLDEGDAR